MQSASAALREAVKQLLEQQAAARAARAAAQAQAQAQAADPAAPAAPASAEPPSDAVVQISTLAGVVTARVKTREGSTLAATVERNNLQVVVIVIDVSGSMSSFLPAFQTELVKFNQTCMDANLPPYQIVLIPFESNVKETVDLCSELPAGYDLRRFSGGTNFTAAFDAVRDHIGRVRVEMPGSAVKIMFMTDGEATNWEESLAALHSILNPTCDTMDAVYFYSDSCRANSTYHKSLLSAHYDNMKHMIFPQLGACVVPALSLTKVHDIQQWWTEGLDKCASSITLQLTTETADGQKAEAGGLANCNGESIMGALKGPAIDLLAKIYTGKNTTAAPGDAETADAETAAAAQKVQAQEPKMIDLQMTVKTPEGLKTQSLTVKFEVAPPTEITAPAVLQLVQTLVHTVRSGARQGASPAQVKEAAECLRDLRVLLLENKQQQQQQQQQQQVQGQSKKKAAAEAAGGEDASRKVFEMLQTAMGKAEVELLLQFVREGSGTGASEESLRKAMTVRGPNGGSALDQLASKLTTAAHLSTGKQRRGVRAVANLQAKMTDRRSASEQQASKVEKAVLALLQARAAAATATTTTNTRKEEEDKEDDTRTAAAALKALGLSDDQQAAAAAAGNGLPMDDIALDLVAASDVPVVRWTGPCSYQNDPDKASMVAMLAQNPTGARAMPTGCQGMETFATMRDMNMTATNVPMVGVPMLSPLQVVGDTLTPEEKQLVDATAPLLARMLANGQAIVEVNESAVGVLFNILGHCFETLDDTASTEEQRRSASTALWNALSLVPYAWQLFANLKKRKPSVVREPTTLAQAWNFISQSNRPNAQNMNDSATPSQTAWLGCVVCRLFTDPVYSSPSRQQLESAVQQIVEQGQQVYLGEAVRQAYRNFQTCPPDVAARMRFKVSKPSRETLLGWFGCTTPQEFVDLVLTDPAGGAQAELAAITSFKKAGAATIEDSISAWVKKRLDGCQAVLQKLRGSVPFREHAIGTLLDLLRTVPAKLLRPSSCVSPVGATPLVCIDRAFGRLNELAEILSNSSLRALLGRTDVFYLASQLLAEATAAATEEEAAATAAATEEEVVVAEEEEEAAAAAADDGSQQATTTTTTQHTAQEKTKAETTTKKNKKKKNVQRVFEQMDTLVLAQMYALVMSGSVALWSDTCGSNVLMSNIDYLLGGQLFALLRCEAVQLRLSCFRATTITTTDIRVGQFYWELVATHVTGERQQRQQDWELPPTDNALTWDMFNKFAPPTVLMDPRVHKWFSEALAAAVRREKEVEVSVVNMVLKVLTSTRLLTSPIVQQFLRTTYNFTDNHLEPYMQVQPYLFSRTINSKAAKVAAGNASLILRLKRGADIAESKKAPKVQVASVDVEKSRSGCHLVREITFSNGLKSRRCAAGAVNAPSVVRIAKERIPAAVTADETVRRFVVTPDMPAVKTDTAAHARTSKRANRQADTTLIRGLTNVSRATFVRTPAEAISDATAAAAATAAGPVRGSWTCVELLQTRKDGTTKDLLADESTPIAFFETPKPLHAIWLF